MHKRITSKIVLLASTALSLSLAPPTMAADPQLEPLTIHLRVDGSLTSVTTYQDTVAEVLQENSLTVETGDFVSPVISAPVLNESAITLVNSKKVKLKVGAKPRRVKHYAALTVADVIDRPGARVDSDDRVSPRRSTPLTNGLKITVTKISYKKVSDRVRIPQKVKYKKTPRLFKDERRVLKPGRFGVKKITYERKIVNGERRSEKRIGVELKRRPIASVVLVGTKDRPGLSGVWLALARCESGGNPRIVSSNGLYHGLFQFSVATWRGVGGSGLPSQASPAEQLKRAKILQARSGWGQWPHCSSVLGLR